MPENDGWKSGEAAAHYKNVADVLVPGRRDILNIISEIATSVKEVNLRILDIGCGHGDVTAAVLEKNREVSCTLIDYSTAMIDSSSKRFNDNKAIRVLQHDLNDGLPTAVIHEKYDAVVSCFSLHHLEFASRVMLYADIRKVLDDGAFFINGDMFKCDSPHLNEWEFGRWIHWMKARIREYFGQEKTFEEVKKRQLESFEKLGDKPGTLWDMYADLQKAGFKHIDCMLKIQNLAVIAAAK